MTLIELPWPDRPAVRGYPTVTVTAPVLGRAAIALVGLDAEQQWQRAGWMLKAKRDLAHGQRSSTTVIVLTLVPDSLNEPAGFCS